MTYTILITTTASNNKTNTVAFGPYKSLDDAKNIMQEMVAADSSLSGDVVALNYPESALSVIAEATE
jgi:hypothetical protein